ncbi:MAG: STAS domain-containing protein [Clostridia bacterium]|nr:STAS domain-containing protein [Clostridia bacterium]
MTITKKQDGATLEIAVEGRLDTMTSPELDNELKTCLDGVEKLILNCEKLDYISSAGLRVLLNAYKVMNSKGGMRLIRVNEIVREVFEVTGFADVLMIE